jgi:hypothetical protein
MSILFLTLIFMILQKHYNNGIYGTSQQILNSMGYTECCSKFLIQDLLSPDYIHRVHSFESEICSRIIL